MDVICNIVCNVIYSIILVVLARVCCFRRCFSPEKPEGATSATAGADLSRPPPLPVRDDDDALLRFRLRWLPFPEAAAEATALATAVAVGPPCAVIPSSLPSSAKKPPDVDRGLVGATIQLCLLLLTLI